MQALFYLCDVARGGATSFELLDLEVQPQRGRLCLFFPSDLQGERNLWAVHAATPAVDEKWVMQCWFRQFGREQRNRQDAAAEGGGSSAAGVTQVRTATAAPRRKNAGDARAQSEVGLKPCPLPT